MSLVVDEQGHAGKCSIYNEHTVMEDGQMEDVALGLLQRMTKIFLHSYKKNESFKKNVVPLFSLQKKQRRRKVI